MDEEGNESDSSVSSENDNEIKNEEHQNSWEESSSSSSSDDEEEEEEIEDSDQKEEEKKDGSDSSSESSDENAVNKRKNSKKANNVWDDNPEVYGIRRSHRPRKEPQRLKIESESESNSDDSDRKSRKGRKASDSWIPTLSDSESEESNSSYEVPQRKKTNRRMGRGKQQRGRKSSIKKKHVQSSASLREKSSKVSYKESSDEETDSDDIIEQDEGEIAAEELQEEVETIEKIIRHRSGRVGETGAQTTMYAVEAEELATRGEPNPAVDTVETQFLIKWNNWSHLHNTWESKDTLLAQKCKGMKKLDNYIKKMNEIEQWKSAASAEDVEYFECQQEMNEEIQKQYQQVERIVAHVFSPESSSSYPDYLCKWQGLPYSECTWEDGSLTARFFQSFIDEYLERERSDTIPNRNAKCLRHRPKFVAFKNQPDFMGGTDDLQLRDYQLDGVNWLAHAWCKNTSAILSDEMGLGKTIQTISFLSYLFHKHHVYGPFLIVVPLSTMDAWQREFSLWAPPMNLLVYIGDVNSRTMIQEHEWCIKKSKKLKFNVILTTYEMLLRDKELLGSLYWACLAVDEAHRLKNDDSLLYRVLIEFRTNFRLLITGTPLQNSLKELWSLMHFIMPDKFDSWEDFDEVYSVSDKEGLQKLHRDLEPFLLRRVKKDVEKSLPAKVEQILRVEMSVIQKQYYKLILTKNVKELCKELKGSFSGLLNIIVQLKKCCNHSALINPLDPTVPDHNLLQTIVRGSGKMILLDKLLSRLKERGHRVLIFSQMVRMLDVIADYLSLRRLQFQRLDGSIRGELRKRAIAHFNAEGSQDFCFLLSTRAGGLGINLASADTVIIFDSDWNPQNDLQAMARAHRIGQKNQVNIYRFVTKNTIEEDIIERAKKKMVLDHLIIQRMDTTGRRILSKSGPSAKNPFNKEELSSILKFGAEELFKDHDQEADQKLQAMDIDEILERAETQETGDGANSMGEELLSQFKVVNYAAFDEEEIKPEPTPPTQPMNAMQKLWEEIIPEDERKKAEEEAAAEEKKALEETLKPRNRKTVEKMNVGMSKSSSNSSNKKFKSKAIVDTESSSDESEDGNDAKAISEKKKTSRKVRETTKEGVKGFTDAELRRFIKSYKKFARPSTRLDSIAEDAELTDKSATELIELADYLKTSCEQAVDEYHKKLLDDEQFDGKKKGATLKMGGVSINAPSVLKAEVDLEPLALSLPSDTIMQKTYRLTVRTRSVHWGVTWGVKEDSMLLIGMLVHGVGNWEAIKNDQQLSLTSKILPVGSGKPQAKHLQSRADYLIKVLREQSTNQKDAQKKETKKKKSRSKASGNNSPATGEIATPVKDESHDNEASEKSEKKKKKKKNKKNDSKKASGVTTPSDGVIVQDFREMDENIFRKSKEKLRPEKKSLQLLNTPDEKASQEDQVKTTKKCLLKIGDHIEKCLDEYRQNQEELDLWRSYLWSFVARFTELAPSKLHRLYRTACRKRDMQREEEKKEIQKMKSNYTSTLHEIGKVVPQDRLELEEARKRALGLDAKVTGKKIPKLERLKIPHKKREEMNRASTSGISPNTTFQTRDEYRLTTDPSKFRASYSRDSKNGHRHHGNYEQHKHERPSSQSKNIETPQFSRGGDAKYKSYREWKESQLERNKTQRYISHEEKPSHHAIEQRHHKHHDEKPAATQRIDKYSNQSPVSSNVSRNRQNTPREQYEREPGEYVSPTYSNSPSSNLISPHYYGDNFSRKRTSSNNSDISVSHKKPHWDSDSNQSWSSNKMNTK